MSLLQLIQQSGNVVTRRVSAAVFQWMLAVSTVADALAGVGAQAQTVYVFKNGNDTTGNGSFAAPFLTIARALTSITTASAATPFTIQVGPGVYTTTFQMKAWTYIEGIDKSAVYLNPVTANWIDASFAAGTQDAGISNVTLQTDLFVNFATVASAGAGTFKLRDVMLDTGADLSFTGNNVANVIDVQNVLSIGPTSSTLTLANITSTIGAANMRNGTVTITGTDAYATTHRLNGLSTGGALNVTWTGAVTANSLSVILYSAGPLAPTVYTISGAGTNVQTAAQVELAGPNANTTFSFGNLPNAGTVIFPQRSDNTILAAPTADRTYTFEGGGTLGTRTKIVNQSAFFITLAYSGGASGFAGMPTYVAPFQTLTLYASTALVWNAESVVQSGTVTLTSGVSALIPCDIATAAGADIVASLRDINGGTLGAMVSAKLAGRIVGTRAGGGGFVLTSVSVAGATVATDNGIYDWHVSNG